MNSNGDRSLIEQLAGSQLYRDYEGAFADAIGLPLALRPVECSQLPYHGKQREHPLGALLAQSSPACAAYLQLQRSLSELAACAPRTATCPIGFCEAAVPVRVGEQLIGFLQTGQFFSRQPTSAQFDRAAKVLAQWGVGMDVGPLRELYFKTKVLPARQQESILSLLSVFANHLAMASNQIVLQRKAAEPISITRAKEHIHGHLGEDLSLGAVSRAAHATPSYLCKLFRKATGLTYTRYLSRVRVEKAKNLLLNPNLRCGEIAYAVGFQSLTHFNRVFKEISGRSPREYRAHLAWPGPG